jgi:hypothetical protein
VPPVYGCPKTGPPSPEVTEAFCRVPSASFSQAPWYSLPVHLCRFGVRSIWWCYFLGPIHGFDNPISRNNLLDPSHSTRFRNINLIPIDYGFRPRLRGRLTLRRLALHRNPWTFGVSVSHTHLATHVSILTSDISRQPRGYPSQTYRTLRYRVPQKWYTLSFGTHL